MRSGSKKADNVGGRESTDQAGSSSGISAVAAALLASLLTGAITLIGLNFQLQAQREQLQTQIDEDRETKQTDLRRERFADFLGKSAAITTQVSNFELDMAQAGVNRGRRARIRMVEEAVARIRKDVDDLKRDQSELLIVGPTSLGYMAWDIAEGQSSALTLTQAKYVFESLDITPEEFGDLASELDDSRESLDEQLDEINKQIQLDTNNLIVAAIVETNGNVSSNPEVLGRLIDELNEERSG